MPMFSSIMPSLGRALSPKGPGTGGAAAAAPAVPEDDRHEDSSDEEFEYKGSEEEKESSAASGEDPAPAAAPAEEPASASSPSPYQAICDLVEATCHDVILLEGSEPGSLSPFDSYEVHAMRLNTYQGQLEALVDDEEEEEDGNEERPLLTDEVARCRYIMGTLVIEACARRAYPEKEDGDDEEEEETEEKFPALIRLTADKWTYMRNLLGKLRELMPVDGGDKEDVVSSFQSLDSQMAAMEALAKLRGQLEGKAAELEEGGGKKYQSHVSFVTECLEEYKSCDALEGIPEDTADMFVPEQVLSTKRCNSVAKVKAMVNSLIEGIEDLIAKEAFPLQSFQVEMLKCVRGWESSYLPVPKLFAVGYFGNAKKGRGAQKTGDDGETPVVRNRKAKLSDESKPKPPLNGYMTFCKEVLPNLKEEHPGIRQTEVMGKAAEAWGALSVEERQRYNDAYNVAKAKFREEHGDEASKPSKRGRAKGTKRKEKDEKRYESESEDSWMMDDDPPAVKRDPPAIKRGPKKEQQRSPKKKQKRIPYSDEEKEALRSGVHKFGTGMWGDIFEAYKDVFKENGRNNVNLKDLYRTMKNRGEI